MFLTNVDFSPLLITAELQSPFVAEWEMHPIVWPTPKY